MKNNISSLSDIYNLVVENYVREYNISASAKELWLDALEPISMEGNVVTLATDTDFKRNTINSIYLEKLEEQFTIVLGNPIKVEIIIKDDIPTTEAARKIQSAVYLRRFRAWKDSSSFGYPERDDQELPWYQYNLHLRGNFHQRVPALNHRKQN